MAVTRRAALLMALAGALAGACANPSGPVPCTVMQAARVGQVDTIGWTIRASGDTVGPALAWTCDPAIHINRPVP